MRASTYFHLTDTDKAEHLIVGPPGSRKLVVTIDEVRLIFSNLEQLVNFAAVIHAAGNIFAEATAPSVAAPDDEVPLGRETAADVESSMPATAPLSSVPIMDLDEAKRANNGTALPFPVLPHKCAECDTIIDSGVYCTPCLERICKDIPF